MYNKHSSQIQIKNVRELIMGIRQYIESHDQNPKIFVWSASVESIMRKISKCKDLLETLQLGYIFLLQGGLSFAVEVELARSNATGWYYE